MKKATVADMTPRMAELEKKRELARTIMGGTEAMRAAGEKYLPKHPAEGDGVYATRVKRTFLDNFLGLAISKAVGKVFAKPIAFADLPPEVEDLTADMDRQGRDINSFMMDVAQTAFLDGISYVLADKPPLKDGASVAEAKAAGVRPYAIHLKPSCLLEARNEVINGAATITLLRWMECVTEHDGEWGSRQIEQVRVLRRVPKEDGTAFVLWEIYREREGENGRKGWVLHDSGPTAFSQIYFVPFYTNRVGFLEGVPGFQNIAESNLEHWQWKSEHAHALSMCCFGMYTATGVDAEFAFGVGPAKTQICTNADAEFGVLETSGVGVTLAADTLKAIESRIETAGVNLRVENGGKVTATAAAIDSSDTHAGLSAVAEGFGDSLEQLLGYFAEMQGVEIGEASAEFNKDFGGRKGTDAGLQSLDKGRAMGDISREGWIESMKWRGELSSEFDADADAERLAGEGPALGMVKGE